MAGDVKLVGTGTDLTTLGTFPYTWTWSTIGQTTVVSITVTTHAQMSGDCPGAVNAFHEYSITGTVTGGTSTYTSAGSPISMSICARNSNHKLFLIHSTVANL